MPIHFKPNYRNYRFGPRFYYGVIIWHSGLPGYALPWTAKVAGGQVSADTLAGVKELIRDKLHAEIGGSHAATV